MKTRKSQVVILRCSFKPGSHIIKSLKALQTLQEKQSLLLL